MQDFVFLLAGFSLCAFALALVIIWIDGRGR